MKYFIIYLALISQYAFSEREGGHTGNGGGTIHCIDKQALVLDYYEAFQSNIPLIDLNKLTRDEFFNIAVERLELGSTLEPKAQAGELFSYHLDVQNIFKSKKPLNEWPEIRSWNIRDELIDGNLEQGCVFKQAAITPIGPREQAISYRIKSVTDKLNEQQIWILELHELLQGTNYKGSSISVRELIAVLLRKKVSYKDMRVALYNFAHPDKMHVWHNGNVKIIDPANPKKIDSDLLNGNEYNHSGLYALDLRNIVTEREKLSNCPRWIGIVPANKGNFVLQLFSDSPEASEDLVMPLNKVVLLNKTIVGVHTLNSFKRGIHDKDIQKISWDISMEFGDHTLKFNRNDLNNCPYLKIDDESGFVQSMRSAGNKEKKLFPYGWSWHDSYYYVQVIRNYYELMRLGFESEYESEVKAVRSTLKW